MKYNFELTEAESINVTNTIERVANRLIDIALISSKMSDLNTEIKNLKDSVQRMREDRNETHDDIKMLRKQVEFVTDRQQDLLENLDTKKK